jgi:hypothetical protein
VRFLPSGENTTIRPSVSGLVRPIHNAAAGRSCRSNSYAERHGIRTRSEVIPRLVDEALTADERRATRESAPPQHPRKRKGDWGGNVVGSKERPPRHPTIAQPSGSTHPIAVIIAMLPFGQEPADIADVGFMGSCGGLIGATSPTADNSGSRTSPSGR